MRYGGSFRAEKCVISGRWFGGGLEKGVSDFIDILVPTSKFIYYVNVLPNKFLRSPKITQHKNIRKFGIKVSPIVTNLSLDPSFIDSVELL